MKTHIRSLLLALVTGGPVVATVLAADPTSPPTTGRILVLANERTLEGNIQRQGDQYRIKRSIGETWLSGDQVLCLCQTYEEAYAYLRKQANLADPDERKRLAQWCLINGLRQQALAEINAAVELRPGDQQAQRLLRNLQRSGHGSSSTPPSIEFDRDAPTLPQGVNLSAEAVNTFVTKVQPIVMNACVNCHTGGKGGTFQLQRVPEGSASNRRTVQQNLTTIAAYLNPQQPHASEFLVKAVSAHGQASQAPLKGKQTPAFRTLEEWVLRTVATNPQLQSTPAAPVTVAAESQPQPKNAPEALPVPTSGFASERKEVGDKFPASTTGPVDPFDPAVFNQQMHPEARDKSAPRESTVRKGATP